MHLFRDGKAAGDGAEDGANPCKAAARDNTTDEAEQQQRDVDEYNHYPNDGDETQYRGDDAE